MKSKVIEIEIKAPKGASVFFPCAGECLRSAWNFGELALHDPAMLQLAARYPRGLPGQHVRIELDTGRITISDPLRSDEWTVEREKLAGRKVSPQQDKEVSHGYLPDWLHQVKRTLDCKCAVLVEGALPEDLGVERIRGIDGSPSTDKQLGELRDALKQQSESTAMLQEAVSLLTKLVAQK